MGIFDESMALTSALVLKISNDWQITDTADLMRIQMLGLEIEKLYHLGIDINVDKIKSTQGYKSFVTNFNVSDSYLQSIIDWIYE